MNKIKVSLPFPGVEIEQAADGLGVTHAADFLQQTIVNNTAAHRLRGLELGSGCGIVTFMLRLQKPQWELTGIEIQSELVNLAWANNRHLELDCRFVEGDIRDYRQCISPQSYDLVYSNPPWQKKGTGMSSPVLSRALSREETTCTMRDVLSCVEWSLSDKGIGWLVYPLPRKTDLARELPSTGLELLNLITDKAYNGFFIAKLKKKSAAAFW